MRLLLDTHAFIWWDSDPFDRLLVAQAATENASLVTHDPALARYPVTIIW